MKISSKRFNKIIILTAISAAVSLTYLYATYQSLLLFVGMIIVFSVVIFVIEVSFGYPTYLNMKLKNKTIEESKNNIGSLVEKAEEEIIIVSGKLNSIVYDSPGLLEKFYKISPRIKQNMLKVEIFITEEKTDPKTKKFIGFLKEHNIPLYKITDTIKINHFVLVDSRHVRLESTHKPEVGDAKGERKAVLRYNTPYLGAKVKRYFEEIKSKAQVEAIIHGEK